MRSRSQVASKKKKKNKESKDAAEDAGAIPEDTGARQPPLPAVGCSHGAA
jgi:hypothetical protein